MLALGQGLISKSAQPQALAIHQHLHRSTDGDRQKTVQARAGYVGQTVGTD